MESATKDYCRRRILCIFPSFAAYPSAMQYSFSLAGWGSFMPPQGILLIAAALPKSWQVRFVDENMQRATDEDFTWADVVFVSGMHVQLRQMREICRRAHALGRAVAVGGPSVSACPDYYPEFDYLHVGELGDATEELFERLAHDVSRPSRQIVLTTKERRALADFPIPAYELVQLDRYMLGSLQYSSGCPYECEFCDIPALYGRVPRLKTPAQVTAELDKMLACGLTSGIFFVDDNFIANRKAARDLLPHLVAWQERNGYPLVFTCETTLNIAKRPDILALMREARFTAVFCGIESPDPKALDAMAKGHNNMVPILQAVATINSYGMEIVSGIILGLDTDTPDSGEDLLKFAEQSNIPILALNLLQALPRTPLWDRLKRDNRIVDQAGRESNVVFRMPYDQVLGMWRECMRRTYQPAALYRRYAHQARATYPNRIRPKSARRITWKTIARGIPFLFRIFWEIGVRGDYRREFWSFVWPQILRGEVELVVATTAVAHHMIRWAREASSGAQKMSPHLDVYRAPNAVQSPAQRKSSAAVVAGKDERRQHVSVR